MKAIEITRPLGSRFARWWVDCSCGWFHGAKTRKDAVDMGRAHECEEER